MLFFESAKPGDHGETLVDKQSARRGHHSDSTAVEETRRIRNRNQRQVRFTITGGSKPDLGGHEEEQQQRHRSLPNLYNPKYDKDGLMLDSPDLDRVVGLYMRKKPAWGIEDTPPPLSFKEKVWKLFTPARVWDAEMVQRSHVWQLEWKTQIVKEDQCRGNVLAVEAARQNIKDKLKRELQVCDHMHKHDRRLRHIMLIEAPTFWEQLGL